MKKSLLTALVALFMVGTIPSRVAGAASADELALKQTSVDIRDAFARGDVEAVMAYHHPDVEKALAYTKHLIGRDAVKTDLAGTLQAFQLEFVEHRVESLLIQGDSAVELTVFAIRGTPKGSGAPFLFKGRALVVYIRYASSPTGWASIREVVQPATE